MRKKHVFGIVIPLVSDTEVENAQTKSLVVVAGTEVVPSPSRSQEGHLWARITG